MRRKKEYTRPEFEMIYVTADAVLTSDDEGSSGGTTPPKQEEDEGPIQWLSLS